MLFEKLLRRLLVLLFQLFFFAPQPLILVLHCFQALLLLLSLPF